MTRTRPLPRAAATAAIVLVAMACLAVRAHAIPVSPARAQAPAEATCRFVLGFATLRELVGPDVVGECVEDERHNPVNGDALQATTGGLLVWRKADNWTAFTDGYRTWVNGPFGLEQRLNTERFPWEAQPPPPPPTGVACGVERWAVKTLSDPAAAGVDPNPTPVSVAALRALPAPPGLGGGTPRLPGVETTAYRLTASLLRFKLEDDRDIHLVVADPTDESLTMITEFPDVACGGAIASARGAEMAAARAALTAACGSPSSNSFRSLRGTATLTGVGFFDVLHGQNGVAPNGIELHPVLQVEDITCART
ncbi:MAG TPA: hypothetical protein VFX49_07040 [Chloroflexota bacterium]|nr:hypothetical protein [Chloroflexota bacterium]